MSIAGGADATGLPCDSHAVPHVDLISASFVVADPSQVAAAVHDGAFWAALWPGLELTVLEDRAAEGIRWDCSGALTGSCEVWLETHGDGVIVHCYLRADLSPGHRSGAARRTARRREIGVNRVLFTLKDRLENRSSPDGDLPSAQA